MIYKNTPKRLWRLGGVKFSVTKKSGSKLNNKHCHAQHGKHDAGYAV